MVTSWRPYKRPKREQRSTSMGEEEEVEEDAQQGGRAEASRSRGRHGALERR